MLDVEEFQRKRKRLFENSDKIANLAELKDYIKDLEIVSANEKSDEIANLVRDLIPNVDRTIINQDSYFQLYNILFLQIYSFIDNLKDCENLVDKMEAIVKETKDIHQKVILMKSQYLLHLLKGEKEKANEKISESMRLIKKYKKTYEKTYYETLYSYTLSFTYEEKNYSEAIANIEECLQYYYADYNILGLIKVIYLLLKLYSFNGEKAKVNSLFVWLLEKEKIQEKLSASQYSSLYWVLGLTASLNFELEKSIEFLSKAHKKIEDMGSQEQMMYEYVELLKLLSRSYAYKGEFQKSYDHLIELLKFIDTDFCKSNYMPWRLKQIYFTAHYTLLFIFVQLNKQFQELDDEKLKLVYSYTKSLIEKSKFSEDLLISSSLSDEEMKKITENELSQTDEFQLIVHQQLISLDAHKLSEDTIKKISFLRDYTHSPIYADILIGKIHLSMGNFDEFKQIVKKIIKDRNKADTPILLYWIKLFELLYVYLEKGDKEDIVKELNILENQCKENNFHKMADEIILYKKLTISKRALDDSRERFKHTIYFDVYSKQSKETVLEYLEVTS